MRDGGRGNLGDEKRLYRRRDASMKEKKVQREKNGRVVTDGTVVTASPDRL